MTIIYKILLFSGKQFLLLENSVFYDGAPKNYTINMGLILNYVKLYLNT